MKPRLRQLATLIHVLDLTPSLSDARSRQMFHAAVYLAQELGLDLGYDFSWHERGAYSSHLTADLYDLAAGPSTALPYPLNGEFTKRVQRIRVVLRVPNGIALDESRWLLLLAATHYLMKYMNVPSAQIEERLARVDPTIPPYRDKATSALAAA